MNTVRVIADDLSGAAEVAGVGCRYGISSGVQLDPSAVAGFPLTVFDTDSRSSDVSEAAEAVKLAVECLSRTPDFQLFKKVDSVLRGHVRAEIEAVIQAAGYRRALIVPVNPTLGRTITEGKYWIRGVPIDQTEFAMDPEHPITTADVRLMLERQPGSLPLHVCDLSDTMPKEGVVIGQAETLGQVALWARKVDSQTVPAGGAVFFSALLERGGRRVEPKLRRAQDAPAGPQAGGTVLVVSGTISGQGDERRAEWKARGASYCAMPTPVLENGDRKAIREWGKAAAEALRVSGFAVLAIGSERLLPRAESRRLAAHLAEAAAIAIGSVKVEQLWLEGGATASAVVRRLGWMTFTAVEELAPGVVVLRATKETTITVKPGSYPWA